MLDIKRYQQARNATYVSVVINALLAIFKLIFGIIGHSQALFADGIHSLSDLITDAFVIIASRVGSHGADDDHPYGHARIETAASVALAALLVVVGAGICIDAIRHLFEKQIRPDFIVLIIAFISVVANEGLYRYTMIIAKRIKSPLMEANAWHNRSDAISSLIVLIGVGGSLLGIHHLDAVAAIIVSLLIVKMGVKLGWKAVLELVDTGVDEQTITKIRESISQVHGVKELHQLRTRSMAEKVFVDVHILVDPKLSVSEGHYIGECVRAALLRDASEVTDVTIHVDPEDDEIYPVSLDLPARDEVLKILQEKCQQLAGFSQHTDIILHYIEGKIEVDLILPVNILAEKNFDEINTAYQGAVNDVEWLANINIFLSK